MKVLFGFDYDLDRKYYKYVKYVKKIHRSYKMDQEMANLSNIMENDKDKDNDDNKESDCFKINKKNKKSILGHYLCNLKKIDLTGTNIGDKTCDYIKKFLKFRFKQEIAKNEFIGKPSNPTYWSLQHDIGYEWPFSSKFTIYISIVDTQITKNGTKILSKIEEKVNGSNFEKGTNVIFRLWRVNDKINHVNKYDIRGCVKNNLDI